MPGIGRFAKRASCASRSSFNIAAFDVFSNFAERTATVEVLRDGAESGGGPGFSAVGAACQVVGVLAHDPGMAEIIVAAGASEPLVALLSTEAAAAAATAIQTLVTNGADGENREFQDKRGRVVGRNDDESG